MQYKQATKITGMMLEMENNELLALLGTPSTLRSTADRALSILANISGAARDTNITAIDATNENNTLHANEGHAALGQAGVGRSEC
eukprot:1982823-Lingulodinium_polyedra.AAC.1